MSYPVLLICLWMIGTGTVDGQHRGVDPEALCLSCIGPPGVCYIRHPEYCAVYYMCWRDGSAVSGLGPPTYRVRCCAPGLNFDPENKICRWPIPNIPGLENPENCSQNRSLCD